MLFAFQGSASSDSEILTIVIELNCLAKICPLVYLLEGKQQQKQQFLLFKAASF